MLERKKSKESDGDIISGINKLRGEKNAVILAHNYQYPEIQDIADFTGDSLGLAREAQATRADVIVFCGVNFMAETASILSPEKTVLIPDLKAICPMANMLKVHDIEQKKSQYPGAEVVLYVNTLAEAKAHCDCVCTSANAASVVNAMNSDTVIFGPDRNLCDYVSARTGKIVVPVPSDGMCYVHDRLTMFDVKLAKSRHPNAKLVVHPEVRKEIQEVADAIASTDGMLNYCKDSDDVEFIIGTENGMLHRLYRETSGKKFYPL